MDRAYRSEFWLTAVVRDSEHRTPQLLAGSDFKRCGALVVDRERHDEWHAEAGS